MGDASFDLLSFDEAMFDEPETFSILPTSITSAEFFNAVIVIGGTSPTLVGFYVSGD